MPSPRTTVAFSVRSYETRPDGHVDSATFLNWFQEAAFANSVELGYPPERYKEMGVSWVLRENDLEILERPRSGDTLSITTWLADIQRVRTDRQYEARRADGTLLARCNTQWVMVSLDTLRPTRIPEAMLSVFQPAQDFVLDAYQWPEVTVVPFRSEHRVCYFEEDEVGHVNNANYLRWVEESARRAAQAAGLPMPHFQRHRLQYRLPAFHDNLITFQSAAAPHANGHAWQHDILRGDEVLLRAWSLSG